MAVVGCPISIGSSDVTQINWAKQVSPRLLYHSGVISMFQAPRAKFLDATELTHIWLGYLFLHIITLYAKMQTLVVYFHQ